MTDQYKNQIRARAALAELGPDFYTPTAEEQVILDREALAEEIVAEVIARRRLGV